MMSFIFELLIGFYFLNLNIITGTFSFKSKVLIIYFIVFFICIFVESDLCKYF